MRVAAASVGHPRKQTERLARTRLTPPLLSNNQLTRRNERTSDIPAVIDSCSY